MPKGIPKLLTLAQLQQVFVYLKGRTRKEAEDLLVLEARIERLEVTSARLDNINVLDERSTALSGNVRSICDRVDRLEEDQSEVAAWKELFDRVEKLSDKIATVEDDELGFDANFERLFNRIKSVEAHAYRIDNLLNRSRT